MFTQLRNAALLSSMIPALLAGCGGSGSQGTDKVTFQNPYSGVVIDGYLQGAKVFADTNRNGVFDAGEPATTTNAKGEYLLNVPVDIYLPPVIVEVTETTVDADTGKPVSLPYRLTTPEGRYGLISPLTTMVQALIDSNPGMTVSNAEEIVRAYLGLSETFELYADYTLKSRPASITSTKWVKFITESGRAHNLGRIAALALGKSWQQATAKYGGQIPGNKIPKLSVLFAEDALRMLAPIAASLPNDGLTDLATVEFSSFPWSREQLDARLRILELTSPVNLSKVAAQGALNIVPFRNAQQNFMHFRLENGGGTNTASASLNSTSSVIAPDLSESDLGSMQVYGSQGLFTGDLLFDGTTSSEMIRDSAKVLRVKVATLAIAGEPQAAVIKGDWLKDPNVAWPANAAAYRLSVKNLSPMLTYTKLPSTYRSGILPYDLLTCCNSEKPDSTPYRLGDLGLKFARLNNEYVNFPTGPIELTSFAGGSAKALDKKGSWLETGGITVPLYYELKLPAEYSAEMKGANNDRLFSDIGPGAGLAFAAVEPNRYALMWMIPGGRYTEVLALNDAAFNALKANLKW